MHYWSCVCPEIQSWLQETVLLDAGVYVIHPFVGSTVNHTTIVFLCEMEKVF